MNRGAGLESSGNAERWDAEAPDFDDAADHGLRAPDVRSAWRALLSAHLPPPPARVADLGCGTGTLSLLLAESGYTVDGVDLSAGMLERAHAKAGDRTDVSFTQADAADPPLRHRAYDVVLCRHVLWALVDPAAALRRWIRLLTPGGCLVLVEGQWSTGAGLTAGQTLGLLEAAGLHGQVQMLDDPAYWGRPIDDHRYLAYAEWRAR